MDISKISGDTITNSIFFSINANITKFKERFSNTITLEFKISHYTHSFFYFIDLNIEIVNYIFFFSNSILFQSHLKLRPFRNKNPLNNVMI